MPPLLVTTDTLPNPVHLPPDVASTVPALEEGFRDGTARNPNPASDESPLPQTYEVLPDQNGRPSLEPIAPETRARRNPGPLMSAARQLVQTFTGSTSAEFDPKPAQPAEHTPPVPSAGRRNTWRAQPQPWDTDVIVTPRLPSSYRAS